MSQVEKIYSNSEQVPPLFQHLSPEQYTKLISLVDTQVRFASTGCLKLPIYILTGETVRIQERFNEIGKLTDISKDKDIQNLFVGVSLVVGGSKTRAETIQKIEQVYADKIGSLPSLGRYKDEKIARTVELMKLVSNSYWDLREERMRKTIRQ